MTQPLPYILYLF